MRVLTCDPNIEVIGNNIESILRNIQAEEIQPFAEKYGLTDIQPDQWYPAENWLNMLNDLIQHTNVMHNLVAIGIDIAKHVVLPEPAPTFPEFLMMWDHIYHKQHRGGDVGNHIVEQLGEDRFKVTLTDIYPDYLSYGVAYGFAQRLLPQDKCPIISYDEELPRRDEGGDITIMYIEW